MSENYARHPKLQGDVVIASGDTPANATDPQSSQPTGTKLVGFGENLSSPVVNRALSAVQKNIDIVHASAFGEMAVPKIVEVTASLQASETAVTLTDTGGAALRAYVDDTGPKPANESGIYSVLDENFDEITNTSGTVCRVSAIEFAAGDTDLSGASLQMTDQMAISAVTRHSIKVTLGAYKFNQNPGAKVGAIYPRPACPGDKVEILNNHANNNTNAGTLDWVVHSVISDREVEVRCVQDPTRSLDITNQAQGTVQIKSTGKFWINPVLTLNFNPVDDGGATKVYVVCGYSRQPVSSVAVPAAARSPFDVDTFMKVTISSAEESEYITDQVNVAGIDEAYDKTIGTKKTNAKGSGRVAVTDAGPLTAQAPGGVSTTDPLLTHLQAELPSNVLGGQSAISVMDRGSNKRFASRITLQAAPGVLSSPQAVTVAFGGTEFTYDADQSASLANVVPYGAVARVVGGGNDKFYMIHLVDTGANGRLQIHDLDGTVAAGPEGAATAEIWLLSSWEGGAADHSAFEEPGSRTHLGYQSLITGAGGMGFRSIHAGDVGDDAIHFMGMTGLAAGEDDWNLAGGFPLWEAGFFVKVSGEMGLAGKIHDHKNAYAVLRDLNLLETTNFGGLNRVRLRNMDQGDVRGCRFMLDVDNQGAPNDFAEAVLEAVRTATDKARIEAKSSNGVSTIRLYAEVDSATGIVTVGNNQSGGAVRLDVRGTGVNPGGDSTVRIQADFDAVATLEVLASDRTNEIVRASAWRLATKFDGEGEVALQLDQGASYKDTFYINHRNAGVGRYGFAHRNTEFGAAAPEDSYVELALGTSGQGVYYLQDSDMSDGLVSPIDSAFGINSPNRFLALGHSTTEANSGSWSSFVLTDEGDLYLGPGFGSILRNEDGNSGEMEYRLLDNSNVTKVQLAGGAVQTDVGPTGAAITETGGAVPIGDVVALTGAGEDLKSAYLDDGEAPIGIRGRATGKVKYSGVAVVNKVNADNITSGNPVYLAKTVGDKGKVRPNTEAGVDNWGVGIALKTANNGTDTVPIVIHIWKEPN